MNQTFTTTSSQYFQNTNTQNHIIINNNHILNILLKPQTYKLILSLHYTPSQLDHTPLSPNYQKLILKSINNPQTIKMHIKFQQLLIKLHFQKRNPLKYKNLSLQLSPYKSVNSSNFLTKKLTSISSISVLIFYFSMTLKQEQTSFTKSKSSMFRVNLSKKPHSLDHSIRFNSFLESKLNNQVNISTDSNIQTLSSKIESRLNKKWKLNSISPDNKINHIMENFKTISTYVDIKDFITQLKSKVKVTRRSKNCQYQADTEFLSEKQKKSSANKINYDKIKINSFPHSYFSEYKQLIEGLRKQNKLSKPLIEQHFPTDSFQSELYNKIFIEENFSVQQKIQKIQKARIQKNGTQEQKIQCQIYVQEYRKQLSGLEDQMHDYLQKMYVKKWNSKNLKQKIQENEFGCKKPLMDIKYKPYAPKGLFEFVGKQNVKAFKQANHKLSIKQLKQFWQEPNIKSRCLQTSGKKNISRDRSQGKIKKANHKYNFQKPQIKNTILKKIVDFIQDIEDNQLSFKKQNIKLNNSICKFELNSNIDYNKFMDDSINIQNFKTLDAKRKNKVF